MSLAKQNYSALDWFNWHTSIENINPSDSRDVIGHYARVDRAKLGTCLETDRTILISIGNKPIDRRVELGKLPTAGTGYHVQFGVRGTTSYGPYEMVEYTEKLHTMLNTSYIAAGNPE